MELGDREEKEEEEGDEGVEEEKEEGKEEWREDTFFFFSLSLSLQPLPLSTQRGHFKPSFSVESLSVFCSLIDGHAPPYLHISPNIPFFLSSLSSSCFLSLPHLLFNIFLHPSSSLPLSLSLQGGVRVG